MINSFATQMTAALDLHRAGEVVAAEAAYRALLQIRPNNPDGNRLLGLCLLQQNRAAEALVALDRAVAAAPRDPIALSNLASGHRALGRARHALRLYSAAAQAAPHLTATAQTCRELSEETLRDPRDLARGDELARLGEVLEEADPTLRRELLIALVEAGAKGPETLNALGTNFAEAHRSTEAEAYLEAAISASPGHSPSWMNLILLQDEGGDPDAALAVLNRAVRRLPDDERLPAIQCDLLTRAGRLDEAVTKLRQIAENRPIYRVSLGNAYKTLGRLTESQQAYRWAIDDDDVRCEAYWSLSNLKTVGFSAEDLAAMQTIERDTALPDQDRVQISFAIAKALHDNRDWGGAFAAWTKGNMLRRAAAPYDAAAFSRRIDRAIRLFDHDFVATRRDVGAASTSPILVVSLPRAGSTLVDQILCSHSGVSGTDELPHIRRLTERVAIERGGRPEDIECLLNVEPGEWTRLGEDYVTRCLNQFRIVTPYFTDKMPNNFEFVGFALTMLPNARVVNCRRAPVEVCLANYMQLFANGQDFSYGLDDLAAYYANYDRLMGHWRRMYPGKIVDVIYEDVVQDQEGSTRALLAELNLPFEPACLRFHETERHVPTASAAQVRQPLYTSALGRARAYEPYIAPLLLGLEQRGIDPWTGRVG